MLRKTPDGFDVNVTGCRYAKFFQEIGAPELGFLLVCSADFDMAEGLGRDVQLTRTQTIMQGASHCDFRYALKKRNEGEVRGGFATAGRRAAAQFGFGAFGKGPPTAGMALHCAGFSNSFASGFFSSIFVKRCS